MSACMFLSYHVFVSHSIFMIIVMGVPQIGVYQQAASTVFGLLPASVLNSFHCWVAGGQLLWFEAGCGTATWVMLPVLAKLTD